MENEVRLINYDAAIDRYYAEYEKQDIYDGADDRDWLKKCFDEAPTIDPESLRPKGRWAVIEGEDWNEDVIYQCSECKEEFVSFEGTDLDKLWNYCPECGAKMEG